MPGDDIDMATAALNRDQRVAYHEAGHAVVTFYERYAVKLRSVTIESKGASAGLTRSHRAPARFTDERLPDLRHIVAEVVTCYAGMEAERQLTGRYDHVGATSDRESALNLAALVTAHTESFLKWLLEVARGQVEFRWYAIEAVAAELVNRRKLSAKEVKQIILEAERREIEVLGSEQKAEEPKEV